MHLYPEIYLLRQVEKGEKSISFSLTPKFKKTISIFRLVNNLDH